jgi:hypothetical protein
MAADLTGYTGWEKSMVWQKYQAETPRTPGTAEERLKTAVEQNLVGKEVPGEEDIRVVEELLWETLLAFQGQPFTTARGLEFSYRIRGHEMFVSRKEKSITRATVMLSLRTAIRLQREGKQLSGPKKLGTFGASYLYPVFLRLSVIIRTGQ